MVIALVILFSGFFTFGEIMTGLLVYRIIKKEKEAKRNG